VPPPRWLTTTSTPNRPRRQAPLRNLLVEPVAMATNSSAADTATTAPTSTQAWAKGNPFDKQKVC